VSTAVKEGRRGVDRLLLSIRSESDPRNSRPKIKSLGGVKKEGDLRLQGDGS